MRQKGFSAGTLFFAIVVILALGIFLFARQDNASPFAPPAAPNWNVLIPDGNGSTLPNVASMVPEQAYPVSQVAAYFCPQDDCAQKLIAHIDRAQSTLDIAIYSFTHDGIADAVVRAHQRGVRVRVIFDYDQSTNAASDDEKLAMAGIAITRRNGAGYMHNKFAVIDGNEVATGSFNYSENANTKNDENLIFVASTAIAQQYTVDFERVWSASTPA